MEQISHNIEESRKNFISRKKTELMEKYGYDENKAEEAAEAVWEAGREKKVDRKFSADPETGEVRPVENKEEGTSH